MRKFSAIFILFVSFAACASPYRARFELDSQRFTDGVRFVEFKTGEVDVAYKILSADEEKVVINVYFTNVSKRTITVDRSNFYVASLTTKEIFKGLDPDDIEGADPGDFFPRAVLKPDDSAGGQIVFPVKSSEGRLVLKNRMTPHSFKFAVKDE